VRKANSSAEQRVLYDELLPTSSTESVKTGNTLIEQKISA
jgi:hypothetical protein